jgi:hypothetical protein
MFSMKPKFNLAEFLAEPAKPSAFRRRTTWTSPRDTPEESVAEEPAGLDDLKSHAT